MLENCPNITFMNFSGCDGYTKDSEGDRDKKVSEGIYGDIQALRNCTQLASVNFNLSLIHI